MLLATYVIHYRNCWFSAKKKDKKNQQLFFPTVSDKQYNEGTGGMGTQANLCAIDD